jgi:hypothetical protein
MHDRELIRRRPITANAANAFGDGASARTADSADAAVHAPASGTPLLGHDFGNIAIFPPDAASQAAMGEPPHIQRSPSGSDTAPPEKLVDRIRAATGTGDSLDRDNRARLESGFGTDLSGVRVHTDAEADTLSRSVDAAAFTSGQDIFFRQDSYDPTTRSGTHLIAHEVAHTIQQRTPTGSGSPVAGAVTIGEPEAAPEQAAAQAADTIADTRTGDGGQAAFMHQQPPLGTASASESSDLLIQRAPKSDTDKRLDNVEHQQTILKKRQDALELDQQWGSRFRERFASYKQAILRISGGMDAAEKGFQAAQVAQAQFDQLKVQLIGAAATFGFALGFEWAFSGLLGRMKKSADQIKKTVEKWENPMNSLASSGVNVAGSIVAKKDATEGQTPAIEGGSFAFLTSNLAELEGHSQQLEQAFATRTTEMRNATDEQWEQFDLAKQETIYQQLFDQLVASGKGVEDLKEPPQVARVLERHLWAAWIKGQRQLEMDEKQASIESGNPIDLDPTKSAPDYSIGTYVEDELNATGVSTLAGVKLSGHWFLPNSPSDWKKKLLDWAGSYHETLKNEGAK